MTTEGTAVLGPAFPLALLLICSLLLASFLATLAVRATPPAPGGRRLNAAAVWMLAGVVTFIIWGAATGEGGPVPEGGITGHTYGGVLHYLTVTSHQPSAGSAWSHVPAPHPYRLMWTAGLNVAILAAIVAGARRWRTRSESAGRFADD